MQKQILIKNFPSEVAEKLSELARRNNQSRNQYLVDKLTELTTIGWQPVRYGSGLKAVSPTGGEITLKGLTEAVMANCKGLNQNETKLYKYLKLIVSPKNGGQWDKAKKLLEKEGFEVLNI